MQHYLNKQRVSILIATFNNKIDPIVLYRKSSAFIFCFMLKRQLFLQLKPNSISWSSILPGKDGSLFCPNTYKRKQPVNAMNIFSAAECSVTQKITFSFIQNDNKNGGFAVMNYNTAVCIKSLPIIESRLFPCMHYH